MARRGRPCRAGSRASRRVDVRLTAVEYSAVARLARANQLTLADAVRLGVLRLVAELDEGGAPPLVLGGSLLITEAPDSDDGFLPPQYRGDE